MSQIKRKFLEDAIINAAKIEDNAVTTAKIYNYGQANGVASLGADGKVPTTQLPALAITDVYAVADIAARDALTVEEGDVAIVTDSGDGTSKTYIYDGSQWLEIKSGGAVEDQIVDGVTNIAPSQNAVHDALALKLDLAGGTMSGDIYMGVSGSGVAADLLYVNEIWGKWDTSADSLKLYGGDQGNKVEIKNDGTHLENGLYIDKSNPGAHIYLNGPSNSKRIDVEKSLQILAGRDPGDVGSIVIKGGFSGGGVSLESQGAGSNVEFVAAYRLTGVAGDQVSMTSSASNVVMDGATGVLLKTGASNYVEMAGAGFQFDDATLNARALMSHQGAGDFQIESLIEDLVLKAPATFDVRAESDLDMNDKQVKNANYMSFMQGATLSESTLGGTHFQISATDDIKLVLGGAVRVNSKKIKDLADGTDATDAVTKQQLDGVETALDGRIDALELASVEFVQESFTLSPSDITNGYIDLANVAWQQSINAFVDRLAIHATADYTVDLTGGAGGKTRITFVNSLVTPGQEKLAANDVVTVKYAKRAIM